MIVISEVMTRDPVVVGDGASIVVCAQILLRHGFRHLPVVDDAGALTGIVGDRDLSSVGAFTGDDADAWVFYAPDEDRTTAGDVALPPRLTARGDARLVPVLKRMMSTPSDVVVVVDPDRRPVGIFTEHDGVALAAEKIPADLEVLPEASRPALTIGVDDLVSDALFALARHGGRYVVVVNAEGRAIGVASHRDVLAHRRRDPAGVPLREIVRRSLVTLPPSGTLADAARSMSTHGIGCLPVLDSRGRPKRVITRSDLMAAVVAVATQEELFAR